MCGQLRRDQAQGWGDWNMQGGKSLESRVLQRLPLLSKGEPLGADGTVNESAILSSDLCVCWLRNELSLMSLNGPW